MNSYNVKKFIIFIINKHLYSPSFNRWSTSRQSITMMLLITETIHSNGNSTLLNKGINFGDWWVWNDDLYSENDLLKAPGRLELCFDNFFSFPNDLNDGLFPKSMKQELQSFWFCLRWKRVLRRNAFSISFPSHNDVFKFDWSYWAQIQLLYFWMDVVKSSIKYLGSCSCRFSDLHFSESFWLLHFYSCKYIMSWRENSLVSNFRPPFSNFKSKKIKYSSHSTFCGNLKVGFMITHLFGS